MTPELPPLEKLPRRTVSDLKDRWAELIRELRELRALAIAGESSHPVVLLDAATYEQLVRSARALDGRQRAALERLDAEFSRRLVLLQDVDFPKKVDAVFAAEGRLAHRPKAGPTF